MSPLNINQRDFLKGAASVVASAGILNSPVLAEEGQMKTKLRKAITLEMLPTSETSAEPHSLLDVDKLKLARACGFEGVEIRPIADMADAVKFGKIAKEIGVPVHSVNAGGWNFPLSDPNPDVVKKGLVITENALQCAKATGADSVLLVPAVIKKEVNYADAYKRSQDNIRKLIPTAKETGVIIAVEYVWNKFLLSPLEFARYIDEFESKWVRAYLDVANVAHNGYPQHWIEILNKRIIKIQFKEYKSLKEKGYEWPNLREGDIDWPKVRQAIEKVGYSGFVTAEMPATRDKAYLQDLSHRMDLIIEGK